MAGATPFKQYTPKDLYKGVTEVEEQHVVSPSKTTVKFRRKIELEKTGNELLDLWLENLTTQGIEDRFYHARKLGIPADSLKHVVTAFTGMGYQAFVDELCYIVAADMIDKYPRTQLKEISDFLGFKAYSTMFRLFKNKQKLSPSGWTRD